MTQTGAEDITVNDVVAFLVEVAAILSLSAWGFHASFRLRRQTASRARDPDSCHRFVEPVRRSEISLRHARCTVDRQGPGPGFDVAPATAAARTEQMTPFILADRSDRSDRSGRG